MPGVQVTNFNPLHWISTPAYKCEINSLFSNYYTLQFFSKGKVDLWIGDSYYYCDKPTFWCTKPNTLIHYKPDPEKGVYQRYIAFTGKLARDWDSMGLFDFKLSSIPPSRDYPAAFDRMLKLIERGDNLSMMSGINILESILLDIARGKQYRDGENQWLGVVLNEFEKTPGFRLNVAKTAKKLKVGESTLRRKFSQLMGVALNEYGISRRIDLARRELINSSKSIKQVSDMLGYSHESFFIRQFTKITNMSPLQYRKRYGMTSLIK